MRKLIALAAAFAAAPVLAFATPALATVQSSIEGGDIYRVKNVTKNVDFTDPATADACDVLEYKVRIHNPGPTETLNNVRVVAAFGTAATTKNVSIITVRADNASPSSTSDTATVNLSSSQTMSFVDGSTQLLDADGNFMQNLPDGITGNGVNIGSVGVSIGNKRYVQFQEKVNCPPVTPPQVSFACTELGVTNIDRTHYDFTAKATAQNATIQSYGFTAKDANGTNVDTNTVNTNATSAVYHFNQSNAGTYTVSAVVNTDHGSTNATACTKQITVAAVPTTPTTPETPAKTLPNTGAGDVLGIFAGASAAGTAAHAVATRRFRR
jgi:hypothetical protein